MTIPVRDGADASDVCVSVTIAAAPETVWTFLSDASRFASWIGAFAGGPPLAGTFIEPRPGGAVRVEYPGGAFARGEVVAFDPGRRIAFTWGYEGGREGIAPGTTRVEITLSPHPEGTLVQLRHSGIASDSARQGHLGGWKHYLSMLALAGSAAQHAERLPATFEAYFAAWGEPDESARRVLIESCCEPHVRVRTQFACTDDVAQLAAHIANAQRHMPGLALRQAAPPRQLHGYARVAWVVVAPDGREVMRGENVAGLAPSGRLAWLVSFGD